MSNRYAVGTVLTYLCNTGYYKFRGTDTRTCQSTGQWNGARAHCKKGNENGQLVDLRVNLMTDH